ncbi:MAG TPA: DUF427 domain-containing protein [Gaiellaceae bacterium]|nr:DUF427 domain-containing protein [Gaiellaceae bacterium]
MGLTTGTGPFGPHPRGRLSFEPPVRVVYVEPWPRRVRALAGGETIVDSERTVLVYESGRLPRYAFPAEDVSARAGAEPEPEVEGYVRVPWEAAERWLEEDEELIVHPHDPYHRIEVLRSSRHVRVLVHGELVAESSRPRILFETGLPPRYYLPREDVRMDALEPRDRDGLRVQRLGDVLGCAHRARARARGRLELPGAAPRGRADPGAPLLLPGAGGDRGRGGRRRRLPAADGLVGHRVAPGAVGQAARTRLKASIARSRCSGSSAADICTRIRAVPSGTTG